MAAAGESTGGKRGENEGESGKYGGENGIVERGRKGEERGIKARGYGTVGSAIALHVIGHEFKSHYFQGNKGGASSSIVERTVDNRKAVCASHTSLSGEKSGNEEKKEG